MHRINLSYNWTVDGTHWQRRFGAPRETGDGVWLTGTAAGDGVATLNDVEIGMMKTGEVFRWDVTSLLKPRNELELVLVREIGSLEMYMEICSPMSCCPTSC